MGRRTKGCLAVVLLVASARAAAPWPAEKPPPRTAEQIQEQTFGVAGGRPSVWRIRYHDIRPDAFSWVADRSPDGGKTWVRGHQTIEARRIGKARTLGPLAPARNAPAARP
jgi:hypothetical protein